MPELSYQEIEEMQENCTESSRFGGGNRNLMNAPDAGRFSGAVGKMERRTYCVYNQTRECFLGLRVAPADTTFSRLKGLIGKLKLESDQGLWVVPSSGIHTLGVLFPLDLVYLDENYRVIHLVEYFRTFRIAPLRRQAASVLELPIHTIYYSQTQVGDQLVVCRVEEMEQQLKTAAAQLSRSGEWL
jgi:uncharacterized membrane protein (UPF0127 family)